MRQGLPTISCLAIVLIFRIKPDCTLIFYVRFLVSLS